MLLALAAVAALYGAVVGLFVPRAVYQLAVPAEEFRRTACPAGHLLPGRTGRNRCVACGGRRYGGRPVVPCVLAACGAASLALAVGPRPELAVWLLLLPAALVLAGVDLLVHRLPDVLTLPLAAGTIVLLGVVVLLPGAGGTWTGALLGAAVLGAAYLLLFLLNPRGMGLGDVKLALTVGAVLGWYGWTVLFAGAFLGFLLGSVYGLSLVVLRRLGRRSALAFGPFMVLGAWAGLLLGA
ncbi:prepilin peptidase [Streptomyces sp. TR02-1]|uniref:prepilin peptidase n=1 Tax=Streptomyces sp. TR02-1 TaxID=3385977 RepID=UPI0039A11F94